MSKIKELSEKLEIPTENLKPKIMEYQDFFQIVEIVKDEKYIIVSGNMQATKHEFRTLEQARQYIDGKPYDLIFTIAYILLKNHNEVEKTNNINNNKNTEK